MVVGRVPSKAIERIAVLRARYKSLYKDLSLAPFLLSSVQTIQSNLGEDGIDDSKAKSIIIIIAEADVDLFDSRKQ
jgi:hypothetical protein